MENKTIKLIYWLDVPNFGDYIGPFLVAKLTGVSPIYKRRWWGYKAYFKELYRICRYRQWFDLKSLTHPFEKTLLTVGSILKYANPGAIIWGSGFMSEKDELSSRYVKLYSVRGCKTANKLGWMGGVGDPALLLPKYISKSIALKYLIGIVPHWSEVDSVRLNFPQIHIIDPRTENVEQIIKDITSCKYILSSSLHGLIIGHAYGIPSLWFRYNEFDDRFKFHDYFSSVGLKEYPPLQSLAPAVFSDKESIQMLFEKYRNVSLPAIDVIHSIQNNLINSFPYSEFGVSQLSQ